MKNKLIFVKKHNFAIHVFKTKIFSDVVKLKTCEEKNVKTFRINLILHWIIEHGYWCSRINVLNLPEEKVDVCCHIPTGMPPFQNNIFLCKHSSVSRNVSIHTETHNSSNTAITSQACMWRYHENTLETGKEEQL